MFSVCTLSIFAPRTLKCLFLRWVFHWLHWFYSCRPLVWTSILFPTPKVKNKNKTTSGKIVFVRRHRQRCLFSSVRIVLFFSTFDLFFILSDLFLVHTLQYAVFLPNTTHILKQREGVLSFCHKPSSVLDSTVIGGLQYFSHCSQFSCTVLCNFHMDVYDFVCCHKI